MSKFHTHDADFYPALAFLTRGRRGALRTLEGGKASAPQADPRMAAAADRQVALAEKQYEDYNAPGGDREWMRKNADDYLASSKETAKSSKNLSDYQLGQMKVNDKRYQEVAVPFEDALLADVKRFDSAEYKDSQVKAAMSDVQSAVSGAAQQRERSQARAGVNPNSGRAAALQAESDLMGASAMAGAANSTRKAAEQTGLATKMQMYGGMKGLSGLGATNAGLAQGAMGVTLGAGSAGQGAITGSINANQHNTSSTISGLGAGIDGFGKVGQLNNEATKINNANDPFATVLGIGAKLAAGM